MIVVVANCFELDRPFVKGRWTGLVHFLCIKRDPAQTCFRVPFLLKLVLGQNIFKLILIISFWHHLDSDAQVASTSVVHRGWSRSKYCTAAKQVPSSVWSSFCYVSEPGFHRCYQRGRRDKEKNIIFKQVTRHSMIRWTKKCIS